MRFETSMVLIPQKLPADNKRKGGVLMYINTERKLVEGLYLGSIKKISENLKEMLKKGREDTVIIILREAIVGGYLVACSKAAAVIGGIILDSKPQRAMLARLGEQVNNPINVPLGNEWVDVVLATNTGLSIDQWVEAWDYKEDVRAIRKLFRQAPYSNAVDECCRPIDPPWSDNYPENTSGRIIPEIVFD